MFGKRLVFGDLSERIARSEASRANAQCGDREPAGGTAATTAAPAGDPYATTAPAWMGFVEWIIPAIADVLSDHQLLVDGDADLTTDPWRLVCSDIAGNEHAAFHFDHEWRQHVAPLIAERIETVCLADQSRRNVESGLDIGASAAAEMFPQHTRK